MTPHPSICDMETRWLGLCAALAIGEYCALNCQSLSKSWPFFILLAILCALFGYAFTIRFWPHAALAMLGIALALNLVERNRSVIDEAHIYSSGRPYDAVFTLSKDATVKKTRKGVQLAEFLGEIRSLRVKVVAALPPGTAPPKAGETWHCSGWLSGWNEHDAIRRRELSIRGKRAYMIRLRAYSPSFSLHRALDTLKKDAARRLEFGLETNKYTHNLLCAMMLGERSLMDADDKKTFANAGAMHVFAISGLHVMVLAKIFVLLGVLTLLPVRFAGIIAIPLVWLYVLMVGAPPSAVRAAAMASICLIAPMFWRRPDGIVAWAMAFIAAHALNPAQIIDAGSGLSFIVMFSLVILLRIGGETLKRPVVGTIIFSSVAWAAGVPICARMFGSIALGGLLSGPIVVPAATCATICGALGILASFISPALAAYPNACAGLIMRIMSAVCSLVAQMPGACIEIAPWSIGECLAWYVAMAASFWLVLSIHGRRTSTI